MVKEKRFVTTVNCIDGRGQKPVAKWIREHIGKAHVDTVTAPGGAANISDHTYRRDALEEGIEVSLVHHRSDLLVAAAHEKCAAVSGGREEQILRVRRASRQLQESYPHTTVYGVVVGPRRNKKGKEKRGKWEAVQVYP